MARAVPRTHLFATYRKRRCPACGEIFVIDNTVSDRAWGYAYDTLLVCSYHCMRDLAKRDSVRGYQIHASPADKRRIREERQRRAIALRAQGCTLQMIADHERVSTTTIRKDLKTAAG